MSECMGSNIRYPFIFFSGERERIPLCEKEKMFASLRERGGESLCAREEWSSCVRVCLNGGVLLLCVCVGGGECRCVCVPDR